MSVRAVLAHEYYGHRPYRNEYLSENFSMPRWKDEYIADYMAARNCKELSHIDRVYLVQSALLRCSEAGEIVEPDDFIRRVLYG